TTSVELSFAAKIEKDQLVALRDGEQLLYAYLPTDEKKYYLPVLVNSSFLTSANRESLHANSVWNQWLFESIAVGLFKWISELVKGQYQYQSYNLIPRRLNYSDPLNNKFNEGIDKALDSVPFIISKQRILLTRNQAIQDFTFLSSNAFIGGSNIRQYVIQRDGNKTSIAHNPFVAHTDFGNKFKELGVSSFEWEDVPDLLRFPQFKLNYTTAHNIEFIKYLKNLIERENVRKVSNTTISSWEFIYDHKSELKKPSQIYFPAPDDDHWNEPGSELSFLHPDILNWLLTSPNHSIWLETLGVIEKTDLSYLQKTILENPSAYTTLENAIPTIRTIYKLYLDRNVDKELLNQLGELKILTKNGSLVAASQCYFSDVYRPRLPLEVLIAEDIFVSESYLSDCPDKDEWRRFFKMMGVKEGIEIISYNDQTSVNKFISEYNLSSEYFHESDKSFTPWINTFRADQYSDLHSLLFLSYSNNHLFAIKFWRDIISNISLSEINELATAFWGNSGMPGRVSGSKVGNYIKWHTHNNECVPTKMQDCRKATDVFLNDDSIVKLVSNYLPVFDGPDLSPDWKSFFQFKSQLILSDYLELLSNIVNDVTEQGKIKKENRERIQEVYNLLLAQTINWSEEDIAQVQERAENIKLPDKSGFLHPIYNLRYYADGDTSIFQDEFNFIFLNSSNRRHPYIENFLTILGIEIFKQENFNLSYNENDKSVSSLKSKLKTITPYLEKWILSIEQANTDSPIANFHEKIKKLEIYEVPELKITHKSWEKIVQFHLKDDVLYVTSPWNSNVSLMYLPNKLCYYWGIKGFENELDFLLRSEENEIQQHFEKEQIELPEQTITTEEQQTVEVANVNEDRKEITPDDLISLGIETVDELKELLEKDRALSSSFFHSPSSSYDKLEYVQGIIRRAKTNIITYLPTIGYDCSEAAEIAPSIFGGIKKDGKDIYIVTRPSDGDVVLLHYTSEFDVLEYVNAEFWYEDGGNTPKQITLGQLLKKTGINRIPVRNIPISNVEVLFNAPISETLDFTPVPYVPQKIAKIISSFANTNGGTLIFGLKEINPTSNEIVGLSTDFRVIEITKKAISLLSPMPPVTYDWVMSEEKNVFVIRIEKSDADILLDDKKYIRKGIDSITEEHEPEENAILNNPKIKRTVAIIIAIEEYVPINHISKVKYAKDDALKFKKMLVNVMKLSDDDIFMLINEEAFKSHLEYNFQGLFHSLTEDDRLIFYYVGHGFHNGITNYLSTYDTHKHHIAETSVSLTEILLDPLRKSKCRNALIFIDACAQIFQDENKRAQISDINDEELIMLSHDFPYYAMFLSCQPGQSSYSSDDLQNGIWTHHLVEALGGGVKEVIKSGKYITDRLLSDYLSSNVAAYTKMKLTYGQNPRA
ncbi:RNA-binding domain-containing protein, partial [uncultured Dysgonomonas sp.]|uniref:RNA-binding domain-containing protein n=1 Tax=uncultured Dysgonomonas sp. TaxID=206096 RepID=UPI002613D377